MANFEVRIIPAGNWQRFDGTTAKGDLNEDRPHIVPITETAIMFVSREILVHSTDLTPGKITLDGGRTWIAAYRFLKVATESELQVFIAKLEQLLAELD